jgi:hypothetical protein
VNVFVFLPTEELKVNVAILILGLLIIKLYQVVNGFKMEVIIASVNNPDHPFIYGIGFRFH